MERSAKIRVGITFLIAVAICVPVLHYVLVTHGMSVSQALLADLVATSFVLIPFVGFLKWDGSPPKRSTSKRLIFFLWAPLLIGVVGFVHNVFSLPTAFTVPVMLLILLVVNVYYFLK